MPENSRQLPQPTDGGERSDEALAASAQAGSLDDFEQLVRRHQVRLVRFVGRSLRHADAQDVVQETFLQAYVNLHRYSNRWRFRTWLLTIARRLTIDHFRSTAARPILTERPVNAVDAPDVALLRDERRDDLWTTARRSLGGEATTALWLFYADELSAVEIGRVMGRSWVWVKTSLHRSRKQLKSTLATRAMADGFRDVNEGHDDATRQRTEAADGPGARRAAGRASAQRA